MTGCSPAEPASASPAGFIFTPTGWNCKPDSQEGGGIFDRRNAEFSTGVDNGWQRYLADTVGASWSPDGKLILYATPNGDINLMRSDGSGIRNLRSVGSIPDEFSFSRDGKTIWISTGTIFAAGSAARGELSRFDSKTRQFQPSFRGISADLVAFSKDGQAVAYVTCHDGILWKANKDGGERVQLTNPPMRPQSVSWSPDGSQIAFMSLSDSNHSHVAYIVPGQGGTPMRLLPEGSGSQSDPSWSPDGRNLIYGTGAVGDHQKGEIHIFDLASRKVTTLALRANALVPLIGYVLWIAGALMSSLAEAFIHQRPVTHLESEVAVIAPQANKPYRFWICHRLRNRN